MQVTLDGKEVVCCNFCDLKPGAVFAINGCPYMRITPCHANPPMHDMISLVSGCCEVYAKQAIVCYPCAKLELDGECNPPCPKPC